MWSQELILVPKVRGGTLGRLCVLDEGAGHGQLGECGATYSGESGYYPFLPPPNLAERMEAINYVVANPHCLTCFSS